MPVSRITRATASSSARAGTAASRSRVSSASTSIAAKPPPPSTATKRKTRTYEAEDGDDNADGQVEPAPLHGPARPPGEATRPPIRTRSLAKKPADESARVTTTKPAPSTRATRTTAASAARATRMTAAAAARATGTAASKPTPAEPPSRGRGRLASTTTAAASTSTSTVGGPAKKPRISAPIGTRMSAAAAAAAKKSVSFAVGAKTEKENIAPAATDAKTGGIRGRPMRKAVGGPASGSSSTTATRSRKAGASASTAGKPSLGTAKTPGPANSSLETPEQDEVVEEYVAPLRQSPRKKGVVGGLVPSTLHSTDMANNPLSISTSTDPEPTQLTTTMMLTSPAKRIPQPPVSPQETMRSPAKRGPTENMFIGGVLPKPGQTASSDLAAEKSTLLASPAKRPQSPIKGFGAVPQSSTGGHSQDQKTSLLMSPAKRPGSAFKLPSRPFDISQAVPSLPTMPASPSPASTVSSDNHDEMDADEASDPKPQAMKPSQLLMAEEDATSDLSRGRGLLFRQGPPSLKLPSRKSSVSTSKEDLTGDMFAPVRRSVSEPKEAHEDGELEGEEESNMEYSEDESKFDDINHDVDVEDSMILSGDEVPEDSASTDQHAQAEEDCDMMSPRRTWPANFKIQAEVDNVDVDPSEDNSRMEMSVQEQGTTDDQSDYHSSVDNETTPKATPKSTPVSHVPSPTSTSQIPNTFGLRSRDTDPYNATDNDSDDDDDDHTSKLPHPYKNAPATPATSRRVNSGQTPGTARRPTHPSDGFTPLVDRLDVWVPAEPIPHPSENPKCDMDQANDDNISIDDDGFDDGDMEMEKDDVPGTPRSTYSTDHASHVHLTPSFTERQGYTDDDIDAHFDTTSEHEPDCEDEDEDVSMLDEDGFDDLDITEEDIALATEAQEMSLLGPDEIDELHRSYEELEEEAERSYMEYDSAVQSYEDDELQAEEGIEEEDFPVDDHDDDSTDAPDDNKLEGSTPVPPVTPVRYVTKEFHTVSKVPLKDADESSPSPSDRRTRLAASRAPAQRHSIGHAPQSPARNTDTIEAGPKTPARSQVTWADAVTPMQTPSPRINAEALTGATIFVDVFTADGVDSSAIFIELLTQMGAKCVSEWAWDPQDPNQIGKIGITHVVFKDGSMRTLDKVQETQGMVHCVGVSWVLDCERENAWVEEPPYYIHSGFTPRSVRRKTTGMLGSPTTPVRSGTRRRSSRRQSTVWERTPTDNEKGIRDDTDGSTWQLSPAPVTPAPDTIARYAAMLPPETPSPSERAEDMGSSRAKLTTPTGQDAHGDYSEQMDEDRIAMLQRTCPPPKRRAVSGTASTKKTSVSWVVTPEKDEPKNAMMRLLAARRKSLQFAPKISSPLSKQWKQREG